MMDRFDPKISNIFDAKALNSILTHVHSYKYLKKNLMRKLSGGALRTISISFLGITKNQALQALS